MSSGGDEARVDRASNAGLINLAPYGRPTITACITITIKPCRASIEGDSTSARAIGPRVNKSRLNLSRGGLSKAARYAAKFISLLINFHGVKTSDDYACSAVLEIQFISKTRADIMDARAWAPFMDRGIFLIAIPMVSGLTQGGFAARFI